MSPKNILEIFNAVNDSIQFSLEVPEKGEALNFLDLAITIEDKKIDYGWYSKPCHSDNSLQSDSWLPRHMKINFLCNYVRNVAEKCSSAANRKIAFQKLKSRLAKNGYKNFDPEKLSMSANTRKKDCENQVFFKLDFINDRHRKRINNVLSKYNWNIQLVTQPAKNLKQCFKLQNKNFHDNCDICKIIAPKFNCQNRFLVYKFTCKECNAFYIGQTSRPFKIRFNEHDRSINKKDQSSALSDHATKAHSNKPFKISDFDLQILRKCHTPLEARLIEARMITTHRPNLNRKYEMTIF